MAALKKMLISLSLSLKIETKKREETRKKDISSIYRMGLNCKSAVFILVAISALLAPRAVADWYSPLSPMLSPLLNGICDNVECGKGRCHANLTYTFGFACECNPGWTQIHLGDHFRFLPCIIPKCSIDYSCTNNSVAPAPAPAPVRAPPTNLSLFDPCLWSYCGGGSCSKTSDYEHKCECSEGYSNLFNSSAAPCFRECSLGADCASLGINLSNSTVSASPPNLPDNGSSAAGDSFAPANYSIWLFALMASLAIDRLI